ncbi:hypothetical protein Rsub_01013 [Raphidocelis subcapitata]|uniref:Glycoside-hydrolase family GH114 TIM-barrel domain-containing protein n=1 Tax=Raphidocelis subcapitata TaxID=307507 RepID=A0A2V0NLL0_9CHLO|nr:hypothetical protein Rsub_01013 [Raphidocelis subcapitata]|eukprot:GBF88301.1 hypothetical protein Rsub_01013 [Raphidocelis subcapitata]
MARIALTLFVGLIAGVGVAGAEPAPAANATAAAAAGWWKPSINQNLTFQYQLITKLDPARHFIPGVQVYFVDGFDSTPEAVAALKAKGNATHPVYPVCYISAGTHEDWRPDAATFPPATLGTALPDWPGERWLNVSDPAVRTAISKRIAMCADKGFVGVDPDNVDGNLNANGLGLTGGDVLSFVDWLAREAHKAGLAVGLKNNLPMVPALLPNVEFFVNEQCHAYNECKTYDLAVAAGKPVFNIEYDPSAFKAACANGTASGIDTIFKKANLDDCRQACGEAGLTCPSGASPSAAGGAAGGGGGSAGGAGAARASGAAAVAAALVAAAAMAAW